MIPISDLDRAQQTSVTQRDVALRAGVSQALASYVLSGKAVRVKDTTRQRVLSAAEALGYVPNPLARGLRGSPTGLVGVIVRDLSAPLASQVCRQLLRRGPDFGYDMVLTDAADNPRTLLRLASLMKTRLCEAVILVGELPDQDGVWADYARLGLPTVMLIQGGDRLPFPSVKADEEAAVGALVDHLLSLGHQRIAYLRTTWMCGVQARYDLFRKAVLSNGTVAPDIVVVNVAPTRLGGAEGLLCLIKRGDLPTAIVASTDLIALGVLAEARSQGITIPEQLSLVGFDDISEAAHCHPGLTTVRQPIEEMVDQALRILKSSLLRNDMHASGPVRKAPITGVNIFDGADNSPAHAVLIVRGSTTKPRTQSMP